MAHVVRSVIGQKHSFSSPSLTLFIQNRTQLLEEETHGLGVVVALAQGVVDVAKGVEGDSQGNSRRQLLLRLRVLLANFAPGHPPIITLI